MRHSVLCFASLLASLPTSTHAATSQKPHIISILQDDLGYDDINLNTEWTKNISSLQNEGIQLTNHYTHWHCSPTRRSFLSGRLPIHHGEQLSGDTTDDIDVRMEWVSSKLKKQGYSTHWFGKWHTGFRSYKHLAISNGFDEAVGSFQTGGAYAGPSHSMRWENDHPLYKDSIFINKPASCIPSDDYEPSDPLGSTYHFYTGPGTETTTGMCDPATFHANSDMPWGVKMSSVAVVSAAECCGECTTAAGCTHWVYEPGKSMARTKNCHIKRNSGKKPDGPVEQKDGSTCGYNSNTPTPSPPSPSPSPPPAPPPAPSEAECSNEYSTDLWGQLAVDAVTKHTNVSQPLYIHLCFEAVHTPYDKAPGDPTGNTYVGMMWRADIYVGALVNQLKAKGWYDNTLIMYSPDNGGVGSGINYPLRGEKHSNWEGGLRTAAFVSGGLIPPSLRGTTNSINMHIVDWYATFAFLAGASTTDDPPTMPLPVDPSNPKLNIYGNSSFPPLDGRNVWPMLMSPSNYSIDSAHKYLVLSKEVVVAGKWKLLVSQPHFKSQNNGWKSREGVWRQPNTTETMPCMGQDVAPSKSSLPLPNGTVCLFDVRADPGEHWDVASSNSDVVTELYASLNNAILGQRDCSGWSGPVPGPYDPFRKRTGCSPPELMGVCNDACANAKWKAFDAKADGPICGVPGCV